MHLMVDLETLGISSKCPVISIGAVLFDEDVTVAEFYAVLDVEEQINGTRIVDGSTIKWWMGQEGAAKTVFKDNPSPTKNSLEVFSNWIEINGGPIKELKVWGNGCNFDVSIMESLFKDYGFKEPWRYTNVRDLRTFKEFVYKGDEVLRKGTSHNALDDARYQAEIVRDGLFFLAQHRNNAVKTPINV
jgi:exodeoxyribonuclease VIII